MPFQENRSVVTISQGLVGIWPVTIGSLELEAGYSWQVSHLEIISSFAFSMLGQNTTALLLFPYILSFLNGWHVPCSKLLLSCMFFGNLWPLIWPIIQDCGYQFSHCAQSRSQLIYSGQAKKLDWIATYWCAMVQHPCQFYGVWV